MRLLVRVVMRMYYTFGESLSTISVLLQQNIATDNNMVLWIFDHPSRHHSTWHITADLQSNPPGSPALATPVGELTMVFGLHPGILLINISAVIDTMEWLN